MLLRKSVIDGSQSKRELKQTGIEVLRITQGESLLRGSSAKGVPAREHASDRVDDQQVLSLAAPLTPTFPISISLQILVKTTWV